MSKLCQVVFHLALGDGTSVPVLVALQKRKCEPSVRPKVTWRFLASATDRYLENILQFESPSFHNGTKSGMRFLTRKRAL